MLALEDHSLEIPPTLQRLPNGKFKYPGMPAPTLVDVTVPVTEERNLDRWGWPKNPADEIARKELLRALETSATEKKVAASQKARTKRAETKQQLDATKKVARQNFVQHFKWDWEK